MRQQPQDPQRALSAPDICPAKQQKRDVAIRCVALLLSHLKVWDLSPNFRAAATATAAGKGRAAGACPAADESESA